MLDEFDEAIYGRIGRFLVVGEGEPQEAVSGSMFIPRGHQHCFNNPSDGQARAIRFVARPEPTLAFTRDIGAAMSPDNLLNPDRMRLPDP